jgi:hypothetical protein
VKGAEGRGVQGKRKYLVSNVSSQPQSRRMHCGEASKATHALSEIFLGCDSAVPREGWVGAEVHGSLTASSISRR